MSTDIPETDAIGTSSRQCTTLRARSEQVAGLCRPEPKMLLLTTEVWKSHGGIQRYMRMLAQICEDHGQDLAVLSVVDDRVPAGATPRRSSGSAGSKWRFCVAAIRAAWRGAGRTTIVGHLN